MHDIIRRFHFVVFLDGRFQRSVATWCLTASLVGLVFLLVPARADSPAEPFVQDQFAIGLWVDPPADDQMDRRYAEIAEANFNLVLGGFGADRPNTAQRQLALCEKYGMKGLVHCHGTPVEQLPTGDACWGYSIRDEPGASSFPGLREQVDAVRKAHPGRLAYINLFPNYAPPSALGTDTYDEHVAQFCEMVRPDVLSMDHYPRFKPSVDRRARDGYCENLATMRKYALEHDIPFWNFFNIMPYGPHTDPTEAQLRWQINASLTYGAKGVLYFCYYTPKGKIFSKGGAIISRDDRKTRHWYQARRLNGQLKKLGPVLMQLTSTGGYRIPPESNPDEILAGTPVKSISRADYDLHFDYLVGVFQHTDGRRAVMLTNYHFAYSQWPTIEFDTDLAGIVEVNKWTGEEDEVVDDSPDMEGLQISLDAGDARLFLLPSK